MATNVFLGICWLLNNNQEMTDREEKLIKTRNLAVAYQAVIEDLRHEFKACPPPKEAWQIHMLAEDVLRVLGKAHKRVLKKCEMMEEKL